MAPEPAASTSWRMRVLLLLLPALLGAESAANLHVGAVVVPGCAISAGIPACSNSIAPPRIIHSGGYVTIVF